jgi:hypothetical protein
MIKTTYFAHAKKLDPSLNLVSIARYTPPGFPGRLYHKLAPSPALLSYVKSTNDTEGYIREFAQQLNRLDPHQVVQELGENPILVCYEAPGKFCHRHLVADWLRQAGYTVVELN